MTTTATGAATSAHRDRLAAFTRSVEARRASLDASVRGPVAMLVEQLGAVHDLDWQRLRATLSDELTLRIWGWNVGGRWAFERAEALAVVESWLARQGAEVVTMRADIDRCFPGEDALGIDGVWSWIRAGARPDELLLVSRRFAWFGTYRNDVLAVVDLYWDVHEATGICDRA